MSLELKLLKYMVECELNKTQVKLRYIDEWDDKVKYMYYKGKIKAYEKVLEELMTSGAGGVR